MMETKPIGIYVHVPFCKRKCNYCDFCSESADNAKIERYVTELCSEIKSYKSNEKISVDSVFFGGGTPSVLAPESFKIIMDSIKETFDIAESSEITAEVNPGTLNEEKAKALFEAGVNRISIGVQSIHENELKILGRIHTPYDFYNTYDIVRRVGFNNVSIDLMYGIPEQTLESFKETLEKIISMSPEHISCYGLIIEEGTPFFNMRQSLLLPSEDDECDMYELAHDMLSFSGYSHYEISNYAKDGYTCRHNLKYWHNEEYIGFGISAHSYYQGKRFYNTSDFDEYFDNCGAKYRRAENSLIGQDPFEYAMLALRLEDGFSLSEYEKIFGKRFADGKEQRLRECINMGFLRLENERISLTYKGFYISNSILAELL